MGMIPIRYGSMADSKFSIISGIILKMFHGGQKDIFGQVKSQNLIPNVNLNINPPIKPIGGIRLVIIHNKRKPLIIKKPNGVDPLHLLQSSGIYILYILYIFIRGKQSLYLLWLLFLRYYRLRLLVL
jgi:hypothetical protein